MRSLRSSGSVPEFLIVIDDGNRVDLDIELLRPRADDAEHARRLLFGEVTAIDAIHLVEVSAVRDVDGALQHVLQGRAGRLEADLHVVEHHLRLLLDGDERDLAGAPIGRREAGNEYKVARADDRVERNAFLLQVPTYARDVDDL